MSKIVETVCIHCGGSELRKTGIYYGKFKTTQRFQCKSCKSYFGIDITSKVDVNATYGKTAQRSPFKGNEIQTNEPTGNIQEE